MASIDRQAIEARGISGLYLMERAGEAIANGLLARFSRPDLIRTAIVCGKGNNGGDGYVVARRLAELGLEPIVATIGSGKELKGDARINFDQFRQQGIVIRECLTSSDLDEWMSATSGSRVFVDAILGTGVRGAPRGLIAESITALNRCAKRKHIVSVDISSGVEANTGNVEGEAIKADEVVTMGLPKVGHVLPPGLNYYNKLIIADIGFPLDLLHTVEAEAELLTERLISPWLPPRNLSAHKGSEGHLLILAGSRGMTGAALLCAKAAIVTGVGLVTTVCPKSLLPIYAGGVWEMLTLPAEETPEGSLDENTWELLTNGTIRFSAVVVGPGLSRHPSTAALVRKVVCEIEKPVLIDGDGLSAVTPVLLAERKHPWIATPHPGEMARLFQTDVPTIQANRWDYAKRLAGSKSGVVVLKGAKTAIASPRATLYVNPTGNPAMASGGMGDVLAGMIGALLAKGIDPIPAAASGVYLHGLAADLLVEETGAEAVAASQVIGKIQPALCRIRKTGNRE